MYSYHNCFFYLLAAIFPLVIYQNLRLVTSVFLMIIYVFSFNTVPF